ncbi:MAG: MarR family winged helix-turn-helix transcriptional regulator [Noviherbaspirillum sp.]
MNPKTAQDGDGTEGDFASYLTFRLDLLKTEMIQGANVVYRREIGLDVRTLRVLRAICDAPGSTSTRVIERTLIEKTLLSKVVADLVERKLVRRTIHPDDARHYQLWPTAAGKKARKASDKIGKAMEEQMLAVLSADEKAALCRIIDKLVDDLRNAAQGHKKSGGSAAKAASAAA